MPLSRQNEPICHFSVIVPSISPTMTYPTFCQHYKWVRFAETGVLGDPTSPVAELDQTRRIRADGATKLAKRGPKAPLLQRAARPGQDRRDRRLAVSVVVHVSTSTLIQPRRRAKLSLHDILATIVAWSLAGERENVYGPALGARSSVESTDIIVRSWLGDEYRRIRVGAVGISKRKRYGSLQQALRTYALWVDGADGIEV